MERGIILLNEIVQLFLNCLTIISQLCGKKTVIIDNNNNNCD